MFWFFLVLIFILAYMNGYLITDAVMTMKHKPVSEVISNILILITVSCVLVLVVITAMSIK